MRMPAEGKGAANIHSTTTPEAVTSTRGVTFEILQRLTPQVIVMLR